jgi:UDP-N-acetylglucosamine 2-epimerase (non-hydrolysing)
VNPEMHPRKRLTIAIGTRPEAIKMAPLIHELKKSKRIELNICITGQHKDLLDQALADFNLQADTDFKVMKHDQTLHETYANILISFRKHLDEFNPDLVVVHGDTATASAVSLSCFMSGTKVAHVEAGLRTWNLQSPFPEEFNRQLISKIASFHFAPTVGNYENLRKEFISSSEIYVTGNTVVDALESVQIRLAEGTGENAFVKKALNSDLKFDFTKHAYVLITAHRRENFGEKMIEICKAIKTIATQHPNLFFVFPVHPNPNVRTVTQEILENQNNVILTGPKSYLEFIMLLQHCVLVLSDSGGIQEEAPSFGRPLILLRESTERPEALLSGFATRVNLIASDIVAEFNRIYLLVNSSQSHFMGKNPFGDGKSAVRISEIILEILGRG